MTTKTICRGGQNYVSPTLEVLDLKNEGVLCGSTLMYDNPGNGYGSNDLGDI